MKKAKLTLIIPFLNEGKEVFHTVRSIRETSDQVDILLIKDGEDFQKVWTIRKDDIEICRECELRYACQDCRAYLSDPSHIYSKPQKCTYNPLL